jgi:thioredoxin reductase
MYDAIIIGGGPAGLSAALVLARARRSVLVCDNGRQRNRWSRAMHGYLTRDGISPRDFIKLAQAEASGYGVEIQHTTVRNARRVDDVFEIAIEDDTTCRGRRLLIATGVADKLPPISNIEDFYGLSVHHCPYCDGWEHRGARIAVYAKKAGPALALKTWSPDVILFTDGHTRFAQLDQDKLARAAITVMKQKIASLQGADGVMTGIALENGDVIARDALFFSTGQSQACDIATGLGCVLNKRGTIDTNKLGLVNVPGLYAAGDATHDVQLVIVAAAEGAKAALAINESLQREEQSRDAKP